MAEKSVEIVADRGIYVREGKPTWEKICRNMEASFRHSYFENGVIEGITATSLLLQQHFPSSGATHNEL